jgi:hypothetical protein
MRKPYMAHLGEFAGVRCWLVDGTWIRNRRDVDFTNGAHHFTRSYIPHDEVWVDREAPGAEELGFLVRHQIRERDLMMKGVPYLIALDRANRYERRERRAALGPRLPLGRARRSVRRELVGWLDGDAVWIVDGREVRDRFDPNFTHGGHAWRYRFIPRREIWIDDAVAERELDFTLAHERHELMLMRDGMGYDDAHDLALALEKRLRKRSLTSRVRSTATAMRLLRRA